MTRQCRVGRYLYEPHHPLILPEKQVSSPSAQLRKPNLGRRTGVGAQSWAAAESASAASHSCSWDRRERRRRASFFRLAPAPACVGLVLQSQRVVRLMVQIMQEIRKTTRRTNNTIAQTRGSRIARVLCSRNGIAMMDEYGWWSQDEEGVVYITRLRHSRQSPPPQRRHRACLPAVYESLTEIHGPQ